MHRTSRHLELGINGPTLQLTRFSKFDFGKCYLLQARYAVASDFATCELLILLRAPVFNVKQYLTGFAGEECCAIPHPAELPGAPWIKTVADRLLDVRYILCHLFCRTWPFWSSGNNITQSLENSPFSFPLCKSHSVSIE